MFYGEDAASDRPRSMFIVSDVRTSVIQQTHFEWTQKTLEVMMFRCVSTRLEAKLRRRSHGSSLISILISISTAKKKRFALNTRFK